MKPTILQNGKGHVGPKQPGFMPSKPTGPVQVTFRFSPSNI